MFFLRGKSKSNKHAAFRVWFARLNEFRSLLPSIPFIALTATATVDTKETIFEVLAMRDPHVIMESPNKDNISYVVTYLNKNADLAQYFYWIANEVIEHSTEATRTIIYCQTIKQCAVIYSTIKSILGEHAIVNSENSEQPKKVVIEMLHSCTPASNKENILQSFQKQQGCVRILVATIAFGMGVDCKEVYRTIHFGPAKNVECYIQESGRAGRDGKQSTAYLLYQGMQLTHVEKEMKDYVKHKGCRRKILMQHFDKEHLDQHNPHHLCCDNCSVVFKCGLENCKVLSYPVDFKPDVNKPSRIRDVTDDQRKTLTNELNIYHKSLITSLLKRDASGKLKSFTHPKFLLGFSAVQITQVLDHCQELFSISDICNLVEIWDLKHAVKIYGILRGIFMDMGDDTHNCIEDNDLSSDEEELLPDDWSDIALDDELANLAIENLSFSQMDDSNNASMDNGASEVPFAALNAVMNLSFDSVLP